MNKTEDTLKSEMSQRRKRENMLVEKWSNVTSRMLPKSGIRRGYKVDFLEGITDTNTARIVASLYENAHRQLRGMEEDTRSVNVGSFEKYVFPIIRAAYANIAIKDLVAVQPMDSPYGAVYYFDVVYGTKMGDINPGDRAFDATNGPSDKFHYADEVVDNETLGTGDGVTSEFSDTLDHYPIQPGTVSITAGSQKIQDDGQGNLRGDVYSAVGSINYETGVYSFTFSSAPANEVAVQATYKFNSEGKNPATLELQLTSAGVEAEPMKLAFRWSIEAQQDLKAHFGMDAETELVKYAGNQIQREINYKIVSELEDMAGAGSVSWEKTPETGVQYYFHKHSFLGTLNEASGLIKKATQRNRGNWLVAGIDVVNVLRSIDPDGIANTEDDAAGLTNVGKISGLDVYEAAFMDDKKFVIGRKGDSLMDTGYVYAPYQGVYSTGTVVLEDQVARRSMAVRHATKQIDAGQYVSGAITVS